MTQKQAGVRADVNHNGARDGTYSSPSSVSAPIIDNNAVIINDGAMNLNNGSDGGHHSNALVLHSSSQPSSQQSPQRRRRQQQPRGMDPSEVIRDRSFIHCDGPNDPPGESPNDRRAVCLDIVPVSSGGGGGSVSSGRGERLYRSVKWVDPKSVSDEGEIDYSILRHYEQFTATTDQYESSHYTNDNEYSHSGAVDPPSAFPNQTTSNTTSSKSTLLQNPRMRIATISSGYKKANFFVREDLDTRIYFHQLEDAIGYMARRGYVKMRSEEEREWKELLGRAHGVVKLGPKKEKQRYRKGKLVIILKKTISDHNKSDKPKQRRSSGHRTSSRKKQLLLEDGPSRSNGSKTARSESSQTADYSQSTHTDRTSLGKSIRCGYKSYSEKFLAEQEEEKRQYMLAVVEGRPLPDAYPSDGGRLLLTDGSTINTPRGPIDPEADSTQASEDLQSSSRGETTAYSSSHGGSSNSHHSKGLRAELLKSSHTMDSNRKGVYGGGVRYFTPDNGHDEEEEESEEETTEDEDFEEEETYEEEGTYESHGEEEGDTVEVDGSDMGSMFSSEEKSFDYHGNAGVESVSSLSTNGQSEMLQSRGPKPKVPTSSSSGKGGGGKSKNRRARGSPPEMAPISDDSSSNS